MPKKTFAPGDILTADDANLFLQADDLPAAIIRVAASAAERDAAWGSPATSAAQLTLQNRGATTIRTDTGRVERYFALYNATTNPGGATTAGWLTIQSGWIDYAATVVVSGCTATVAYAQYNIAPGKVTVRFRLNVTAMSANPGISLPIAAKDAGVEHLMGAVALIPAAGSEAPAFTRKSSATAVTFYAHLVSGTNVFINNISGSNPINFVGASITGMFEYAI